MNSKTTGIWFILAVALAAFIFIFQHYLRPSGAEAAVLLPGLRPASVTAVQVIPANSVEIRGDLTNGSWRLTKPVFYPAQSAAVTALLDALAKLTPNTRISAGELRANPQAETEFGFDKPQFSLVIEAGDQHWQLLIGNRTAPGNEVYLRIVGVDTAFVADAGWLALLPHAADEWRDTALVDAAAADVNWVVLTNGTKVIELRRDPTNRLWRMTRPLQARADTELIAASLQRLQSAHVTQFISDNSNVDLSAFGLQPADLDLWLGHGTDFTTAVHAGKSPTNDATQVYARREGWNTVFTTARDPLLSWRGAVNDFRDSHLLELTAPVTEIEIRSQSSPGSASQNNFILQQQGTNGWKISGEKFSADADNVQLFLSTLAGLKIAEFVKDGVTAPVLPDYGLDKPQREIILRSKAGDTNSTIVQLQFGGAQTNEIFMRRADEDSIYAVTMKDFYRLPEASWEFRDRRIWDFKVADVAAITLHQNGKTRQIIHKGPNQWTLGPDSQGIIFDKYIEQAVEQLNKLTAYAWLGPHLTDLAQIGFNTNSLQITFELKNGDKNTVDFGAEYTERQTAVAAVTLDGERWVFLFPPIPYQLVLAYLTIPANVP
jgi:hypothetical protein